MVENSAVAILLRHVVMEIVAIILKRPVVMAKHAVIIFWNNVVMAIVALMTNFAVIMARVLMNYV